MQFSKGVFVSVVANIITTDDEGNVTTTEVTNGSSLSNVVIASSAYETETIASAKVLGFKIRPFKTQRGITRMYDSVAMSKYDPNGGAKYGTLEEEIEVRALVLEIPGEEEGDPSTTRVVVVDTIKEIGEASDPDSEDDSEKVTVSFDANGGTGTMESVTLGKDSIFKFPENGFTAPSGKVFLNWSVNGEDNDPGDQINVPSDLTVKAIWIEE